MQENAPENAVHGTKHMCEWRSTQTVGRNKVAGLLMKLDVHGTKAEVQSLPTLEIGRFDNTPKAMASPKDKQTCWMVCLLIETIIWHG